MHINSLKETAFSAAKSVKMTEKNSTRLLLSVASAEWKKEERAPTANVHTTILYSVAIRSKFARLMFWILIGWTSTALAGITSKWAGITTQCYKLDCYSLIRLFFVFLFLFWIGGNEMPLVFAVEDREKIKVNQPCGVHGRGESWPIWTEPSFP